VWRPDEADAAWLTAVLGAAGVIGTRRVVDVEAEPVGTGQMADSVRLRLTYDGDAPGAPSSVVGKFTPADETSRATALALRTSEVEVRFYQEVAPTVAIRTPRCYFADVDTATAAFALVLEDMAPARQGDQMAACTGEEAALALAELSRLRGPRWADPALDQVAWLDRRHTDAGAAGEEVLPLLFEGFVARYGDHLDEGVVAVGERLFPRIGAYLRPRPGPRTVVHADYRLDNLLFGTDEGTPAVTVVDWQTVTLGPGPADVAYFLGAGLVPEERRARESDLVGEYHDRLRAGGVVGYSRDDCMTEYRRHAYGGYIMAVGASMLVERTVRGDEMFLTMARRHAAQVLDLGSEALLAAE
jgi:aminoglycoside/choline kinase family phosphotransferase